MSTLEGLHSVHYMAKPADGRSRAHSEVGVFDDGEEADNVSIGEGGLGGEVILAQHHLYACVCVCIKK